MLNLLVVIHMLAIQKEYYAYADLRHVVAAPVLKKQTPHRLSARGLFKVAMLAIY
jgi:hypothetical protein